MLAAAGCDSGPTGVPFDGDPDSGPDSIAIPLSAGEIGLVLDVRDIFKRGYFPAEVEVTFAELPALSSRLPVNPLTNVAVLRIANDSLSEAQESAFARGVPTTIVVRDSNEVELGRLEDDQVLDASNAPLSVGTTSPQVLRPMVIEQGRPLLLLNELGEGAVIARLGPTSTRIISAAYTPLAPSLQQFVFTYNTAGGFYELRQGSVVVCQRDQDYVLAIFSSCPNNPETGPQLPARFQVEREDRDGWVRLVVVNTYTSNQSIVRTYVGWGLDPDGSGFGALILNPPSLNGTLDPAFAPRSHFRLLADNIDWTIVDRGTAFTQPIMPPAKVDFAYQTTLTNCSPATLTETVGRTQTRTRKTTFGTTESVQVLSSSELTLGAKLTASAGVDVSGIAEVTIGAEVSREIKFSSATTVAEGNTFEQSTEVAEVVSRSREILVPPFTAVVASDFVRTISEVITPLTQTFRLRARYKAGGPVLTGAAIASQLSFNTFEGLLTKVGADYVDFSIRGQAFTNQFFQSESTVAERDGVCR